jgi:hypothetical protein
MADLSDVQSVLVGLIAGWLYPQGGSGNSVLGFPVRIGQGWPTAASLDPDLYDGVANISIYANPMERKTTRYLQGWQIQKSNAPTLTLNAVGRVITVGGTNPAPYSQQNCAVFVNGEPYTYPVQATDTLNTIASALAAVIAIGVPGTVSAGQTIVLPSGALLGALRVGGTGTAVKVVKNQSRLFQIIVWAATSVQRSQIVNLIDPMLADMPRIGMPDGLYAHLSYHDSPQIDLGEKARLYRRDIRYMVDFSTTKTQGVAQVIVGRTVISDEFGNIINTTAS